MLGMKSSRGNFEAVNDDGVQANAKRIKVALDGKPMLEMLPQNRTVERRA
jgi:hypothetical protein